MIIIIIIISLLSSSTLRREPIALQPNHICFITIIEMPIRHPPGLYACPWHITAGLELTTYRNEQDFFTSHVNSRLAPRKFSDGGVLSQLRTAAKSNGVAMVRRDRAATRGVQRSRGYEYASKKCRFGARSAV